MSEPTEQDAPRLALYRCNTNMMGLGAGTWIEIDPEDPAWWGAIEAGFIVADAEFEGERGPEYPGPLRTEEIRAFEPITMVSGKGYIDRSVTNTNSDDE